MRARLALTLVLPVITGCPSARPPASMFPTADALVSRARATLSCGTGVQAAAKLDHFGDQGRVRGDLLMLAVKPAKLRMDVVSPFGVAIATLTSDGESFALADLRDRRFYVGPASACNIARLTTVPIPGNVLVDLFLGTPPVLKHEPASPTIAWSPRGYYVVTIPSTREALEELHLTPHPDDFGKPWALQRVRLSEVTVKQYGSVLYRAELGDHAPAKMSTGRVDPDGLDPPIPPSGPECTADLPRRIRVEVPDVNEEVLFRYVDVTWNPPLPDGIFTQPPPAAMPVSRVRCD